MIYTLNGTPLTEALPLARLAYAEWQQRHAVRRENYLINRDSGKREHIVGRDKNGDVYPVYRAWHVHRSGAGYAARQAEKARVQAEVQAEVKDAWNAKQAVFAGALDGGKTEMVQQMTRIEPSLWHAVTAALKEHGTQRKAAAALGISLGKLQRTLKMVPGGAVA